MPATDRRRDAYPLNGSATATLSNPCPGGQRAVVGFVPRANGRGSVQFCGHRPSNATFKTICPPMPSTRQVTVYTRSFDVGVVPSRSSLGPLPAYLASAPPDRRNDLQKGTSSLGLLAKLWTSATKVTFFLEQCLPLLAPLVSFCNRFDYARMSFPTHQAFRPPSTIAISHSASLSSRPRFVL